jgi:polysaccharide pyruvyl transferase WcaK-like protein
MHAIDHDIGSKLASRLRNDRFSVQPLTPRVDDVLAQLLEAQWVVGQRLHATCARLFAGHPESVAELSAKCLDFLESIALEELAVPTDSISLQDLIDRFSQLLARSAELRNELNSACNVLRERQISTAARLVSALG